MAQTSVKAKRSAFPARQMVNLLCILINCLRMMCLRVKAAQEYGTEQCQLEEYSPTDVWLTTLQAQVTRMLQLQLLVIHKIILSTSSLKA